MSNDSAINLLESALADLKAGDDSALSAIGEALRLLGVDLDDDDEIQVGDISDAVGVAVGNNIRMMITQEVVALPDELDQKLTSLLETLTRRDVAEATKRHIRIFLSSPGDVTEERALAMKVVENLPYDPLLHGRISVEVVAWDRPGGSTPMLATLTPQEAINQGLARPSDCDIVISIFWSRMGTPLGEEYHKPEDFWFEHGTEWEDWRYFSGTEWEYVDAVQQANETGRPLVVVYRRTEAPTLSLRDPQRDEKIAQYELVEAFFTTFTDEHGVARRGVNSYEAPSDFEEQFERHLRDLVARLIYDLEAEEQSGVEIEPVELWEGSPFPGLRAFGPDDAPIFFGRGSETDELVEQLREKRFVAVVGASGSGKSSLVGAGLLPRLAKNAIPGSQDWRMVRFTPDELGAGDPFASLTAALLDQTFPINIGADMLRQQPDQVDELLASALEDAPSWAEFLIFVDQFEELFTRVDQPDRVPFVEMLREAAASDRVRVVVTLRGDFYKEALEFPPLEQLIKGGTYPLYTPRRDALREMIERPAERAGLSFERGTVARILNDTGDDPGALALLAFALQHLYETGKTDGILTTEEYEAFGGVQGGIGQQAQAAFDELDAEAQAALPMVFRELVEISAEGTPTRRRADLAHVAHDAASRRLIDQMTAARLLVQGQGEQGLPTVEVAHEAIFNSWGRLALWIEQAGEDLRQGAEILAQAREWRSTDDDPSYLLRGIRLEAARYWLDRASRDDLVNDLQREFVQASLALEEQRERDEEKRRQGEVRRLRVFIGVLAGIAALAALLGLSANRNAQQARGLSLEVQSVLANREGSNDLAALLALETLENYPHTEQASIALASAIEQSNLRGIIPHPDLSAELTNNLFHMDTALSVISPDGTRLAVADVGQVLVYDLERPSDAPATIPLPGSLSSNLYWNQEGDRLGIYTVELSNILDRAFSGLRGDLLIWDEQSQAIDTRYEAVGDIISPQTSQGLVISPSQDRPLMILDSEDFDSILDEPRAQRIAEDYVIFYYSVNLSQDSRYLVIDNQTTLADQETPDGGFLYEVTVTLIDVESEDEPRLLQSFVGDNNSVNTSHFSPDSQHLLISISMPIETERDPSATADDTAPEPLYASETWLYNLEDIANPYLLHADIRTAYQTAPDVSWSPDGSAFVLRNVNNETGTSETLIFDTDAREIIQRFDGGVSFSAWSPDSTRVLLGTGGVAVILDMTGETLPVSLDLDSSDGDVEWSADGTRLLYRDAGRFVILRADTGDRLTAVNGSALSQPRWIGDSSTRFTTFATEETRLWDLSPSGRSLRIQAHESAVVAVSYSASGARVATTDGSSLREWQARSGRLLRAVTDLPAPITDLTYHPSQESLLLFSGEDGMARLWDMSTQTERLALDGGSGPGTAVAFSEDGSLIATGGEGGLVRIWSTDTGELIRELPQRLPEPYIADLLDRTTEGELLQGPLPDQQLDEEKYRQPLPVLEFGTFDNDSLVIYTGITEIGRLGQESIDGFVMEWNPSDWSLVDDAIGHDPPPSKDAGASEYLIASEIVWTPEGEQVESGQQSTLQDFARAPNTSQLATVYADGSLWLRQNWQSESDLIATARACCVHRELTLQERLLYNLPVPLNQLIWETLSFTDVTDTSPGILIAIGAMPVAAVLAFMLSLRRRVSRHISDPDLTPIERPGKKPRKPVRVFEREFLWVVIGMSVLASLMILAALILGVVDINGSTSWIWYIGLIFIPLLWLMTAGYTVATRHMVSRLNGLSYLMAGALIGLVAAILSLIPSLILIVLRLPWYGIFSAGYGANVGIPIIWFVWSIIAGTPLAVGLVMALLGALGSWHTFMALRFKHLFIDEAEERLPFFRFVRVNWRPVALLVVAGLGVPGLVVFGFFPLWWPVETFVFLVIVVTAMLPILATFVLDRLYRNRQPAVLSAAPADIRMPFRIISRSLLWSVPMGIVWAFLCVRLSAALWYGDLGQVNWRIGETEAFLGVVMSLSGLIAGWLYARQLARSGRGDSTMSYALGGWLVGVLYTLLGGIALALIAYRYIDFWPVGALLITLNLSGVLAGLGALLFRVVRQSGSNMTESDQAVIA